jgi:gluconate 2-dehydrogenase gamma chain
MEDSMTLDNPVPPLRRRRFVQLAGSATAAGVLASCGRPASPWRFLSAAEGRTLEALCDQIVPADQAPGAAEAGVVNYIDRQLMGPFRKQRDAYRKGLAALDQAALRSAGQAFAALDPASQAALLSGLQGESRRFFSMVVAHTMQGYYGDPRHGGNREAASWRMLGVPVLPIRGRAR